MSTAAALDIQMPATEAVPCYHCGAEKCSPLLIAHDDLSAKPGDFPFVTCDECGLAYQNPRVSMSHIQSFYDDEYIAHRKRSDWGLAKRLFERAMDKLDRKKTEIVERVGRLTSGQDVLDVGCGAGAFLAYLQKHRGVRPVGVDFMELGESPSLRDVEFHCGLFYEAGLAQESLDVVTMWHFLEHDYDPKRSLRMAHRVLRPGGHLVVEVPRLDSRTYRWFGDRWPGLQAPQHTVLFTKDNLLEFVEEAGFEVVEHLPYGAYPAWFYIFAGACFRLRKGKRFDLRRVAFPYVLLQLLMSPVLLFEKRLNLAMQTVVCRRKS
ncbi:MAG: SAM-dependent methyltransferase [Hyphomicrobiaceae bacterium]|jgi:SAM-dependent methyltransferase